MRHGPHHDAHQSTRTMPSASMVSSTLPSVSCKVAMADSLSVPLGVSNPSSGGATRDGRRARRRSWGRGPARRRTAGRTCTRSCRSGPRRRPAGPSRSVRRPLASRSMGRSLAGRRLPCPPCRPTSARCSTRPACALVTQECQVGVIGELAVLPRPRREAGRAGRPQHGAARGRRPGGVGPGGALPRRAPGRRPGLQHQRPPVRRHPQARHRPGARAAPASTPAPRARAGARPTSSSSACTGSGRWAAPTSTPCCATSASPPSSASACR